MKERNNLVEKYLGEAKKPSYDEKKMKRLLKKDRFLQNAYWEIVDGDSPLTQNKRMGEKAILKAIFNSFVLGDSAMEMAYDAA